MSDATAGSPSSPLRVLCVDDNPLVLEALALKLLLAGGFEWLDPLSGAERLVSEVQARTPNIILLDLDMPGRDPLDALDELTDACPDVRVLVFSGHVRADLIDRAIEAGAWGYLSKHAGSEAIVSAIRRVAHGEFYFSPEFDASGSASDRNGRGAERESR